MFSVKEITEKILIYFRKHSRQYKQVLKVCHAIQGAKLYIHLGSQTFLCVALAQGLHIGCKEEVVKHIPEFNFKWFYEHMPEEYRPNHPGLHEYYIMGFNPYPKWPLGDVNYVWWLSRDLEWGKKARLKALEVLAEHYHNKLQQILQGKKV